MGPLLRTRIDRRIAGVCGGIARQQGWDSNVVRLVWVALVLFGGTGVLAYIVLWVVIPEEPYAFPPPQAYGQPYGGVPGSYYPPQPGAAANYATSHQTANPAPDGGASTPPAQGPPISG